MTQTLNHSPADVVSILLIDLEVGENPDLVERPSWPVFTRSEPALPDEVITVYDTVGMSQGRLMVDGELVDYYGIQVRLRARTDDAGWLKMDEVRTALSKGVYQTTVVIGSSEYLVHCLHGFSQILPNGKEVGTSERSIFTLNFLATIIPQQ